MDTTSHLQTIELLKAAKPLFEGSDSYVTAAIGALSAIGGALAAYFPNYWLLKENTKQQRKSTTFQIYAELKATLEVERHRKYISSIRSVVRQFDEGKITSFNYKVEVPDERFIIYKSNLNNLGLLPSNLQAKIVLIYQLLEALVQDIKPGGMLNAEFVGREPFDEVLNLLKRAKTLCNEVLAEIEAIYPDVA